VTIKNVPSDLQPDPYFDPGEKLYRRIDPQYTYEGNRVRGAALQDIQEKNPSCSFNRSKYSDPECVLDLEAYPEQTRIACLAVKNLPEPFPHNPNTPETRYGLKPIHLPEPGNYSHTEVTVTKQGNLANKIKNEITRRNLREALADEMSAFDP